MHEYSWLLCHRSRGEIREHADESLVCTPRVVQLLRISFRFFRFVYNIAAAFGGECGFGLNISPNFDISPVVLIPAPHSGRRYHAYVRVLSNSVHTRKPEFGQRSYARLNHGTSLAQMNRDHQNKKVHTLVTIYMFEARGTNCYDVRGARANSFIEQPDLPKPQGSCLCLFSPH